MPRDGDGGERLLHGAEEGEAFEVGLGEERGNDAGVFLLPIPEIGHIAVGEENEGRGQGLGIRQHLLFGDIGIEGGPLGLDDRERSAAAIQEHAVGTATGGGGIIGQDVRVPKTGHFVYLCGAMGDLGYDLGLVRKIPAGLAEQDVDADACVGFGGIRHGRDVQSNMALLVRRTRDFPSARGWASRPHGPLRSRGRWLPRPIPVASWRVGPHAMQPGNSGAPITKASSSRPHQRINS